jgi:hypothetical protein
LIVVGDAAWAPVAAISALVAASIRAMLTPQLRRRRPVFVLFVTSHLAFAFRHQIELRTQGKRMSEAR